MIAQPESHVVNMNTIDYNRALLIHGYRLDRTCLACPEQYDVFAGDLQVAYFRLRHGRFRVDVPDCGGETIYEASPEGDGIFTDNERMRYLTEAITAVQTYYANHKWYTQDYSLDNLDLSTILKESDSK